MNKLNINLGLIFLCCTSVFSSAITVKITSPTSGSTVSSPVQIRATAYSGHTITGWWVYVDNVGVWNTGITASISPTIAMSAGTHKVTVRAWNSTGSYASAYTTLTVQTSTTAVSVSVSPQSSSLQTGASAQFTASVTGTTNTSVIWLANGIQGGNSTQGTISAVGLYTAPAVVPSATVAITARSVADSTKSANATVTITAVAPPPPVGTANYYVSPTGSNSNPCTQAAPCADPAYVVNNKAVAGNTVQAAPGTYDYGTGYANFARSGTAGNYIKLVCAVRGACKIQNSATGNATVVFMRGNYLQITGFEITNTGASNNMAFYVGGSNILINQNTIHHIEVDCSNNGGGGIQLANGVSNIVMDSNRIYDIGWARGCSSSTVQFDGILAETTGTGIVITNNVVYHVAGGWGILYGNSSGTSGSAVISNNTVFSNANGGIALVNGGDYSTISNNNVLNNGVISGQCGIWTIYAADSHVLISRNNVYGNVGGDYCHAGSPIKSGNISINPALGTTFANWQGDGSGDYHLKSGSPLVDAGGSTCASGSPAYILPGVCAPSKDYDLKSRPNGGAWDIGAYEY